MLRVFLFWLKMDLEAERISRGRPDLAMEAVNSVLGAAASLDKLALTVDEVPVLFFFFWPHRMACGILVLRPGIEPRAFSGESTES